MKCTSLGRVAVIKLKVLVGTRANWILNLGPNIVVDKTRMGNSIKNKFCCIWLMSMRFIYKKREQNPFTHFRKAATYRESYLDSLCVINMVRKAFDICDAGCFTSNHRLWCNCFSSATGMRLTLLFSI